MTPGSGFVEVPAQRQNRGLVSKGERVQRRTNSLVN